MQARNYREQYKNSQIKLITYQKVNRAKLNFITYKLSMINF